MLREYNKYTRVECLGIKYPRYYISVCRIHKIRKISKTNIGIRYPPKQNQALKLNKDEENNRIA